jgi:hypothetical protein
VAQSKRATDEWEKGGEKKEKKEKVDGWCYWGRAVECPFCLAYLM